MARCTGDILSLEHSLVYGYSLAVTDLFIPRPFSVFDAIICTCVSYILHCRIKETNVLNSFAIESSSNIVPLPAHEIYEDDRSYVRLL